MKRLLFSVLSILLLVSGCVYVPSMPGISGGQAPVINSFEANPETISAGSRAQLSWSVSDAGSVTIDNGIGSVALRGTRTVVPAATTVYTITATNQYGSRTATAQVIVSGSTAPSYMYPVINSFTITPGNISSGASAILNWNISNATSASIDPGIGTVNPVSGSQYVSPATSVTYTLTATNASGSVTYPVTISVSGAIPSGSKPVINLFQASPEIIAPGASTTLSWNVSNVSQVTIISGGGSFLMVEAVGSVLTTPAATQTFTLQATNSSGMASKTITVGVSGGGGADVTAPSVPTLLSPAAGATLPQPGSAWSFDWSDSTDAESGIQQYEIYVIHQGSLTAAIDAYTATSSYSVTLGGSIGAGSLDNWTWKVRAQNMAGIWSDWSATRTFNVAPAGGADVTAPSVPVLLAPAAGATLPQPSSAWSFDWANSTDAESGIQKYEIYVIHVGSVTAAIDAYTATSSYTVTLGGSVGAGSLNNWTWKVRAQNNAGIWSDWSDVRTFNIAP